MECLITNKVCAVQGQKCKDCKLDDCRSTISMLETQEEIEDRWKRKQIINELPEQCKNCSFLEIIDLDKQIVRCPYRVKDKCIIKK